LIVTSSLDDKDMQPHDLGKVQQLLLLTAKSTPLTVLESYLCTSLSDKCIINQAFWYQWCASRGLL